MIVPMNRATDFSRASDYFNTSARLRARSDRNRVETVNAERATRVHIRQAKGVFRHWKLRWFP